MADGSKIEWTDATWNPITGCSVVSPGCTNCYAMKLAGGRLRNHPSRAGLTEDSKAGPVWNGEVRLNEDWLYQPIPWTKPRRVFVCAHGDLFHEAVPDEWLDRVFSVMAGCRRHQFQVLTKRSKRMLAYMTGGVAERLNEGGRPPNQIPWPLRNVWMGVSIEDQERITRVRDLMDTPAEWRFVSAEPLLGPLDLTAFLVSPSRLDWVIAGGESGPNARPPHPGWIRGLRDQCIRHEVAFFFKQWGEFGLKPWSRQLPDLPPRFGRGEQMVRLGKKRAGRMLDGREWNEMPA